MNKTIYILIFFTFLTACSTKSDKKDKNSPILIQADVEKIKTDSIIKSRLRNSKNCDLIYDTITNKKYNMHLSILDKFHNKEKRGYFVSPKGDTLNHFLYHQDIAAFALGLDSTEKGIYKQLTNKVVFLIIEQDPKMLDYGLAQWIKDEKQLDYFMTHVSSPICNTLPIDSIISIIKREMGETFEGAKEVKKRLIEQLEKSKK